MNDCTDCARARGRAKMVAQRFYDSYLRDMTKAYTHPVGSWEWLQDHQSARLNRTVADRAVWVGSVR